ncbi:Malonyl CoA-acyl carrier protein transacylase [Minicystis rosea]|nr:Malonyl CoA-acyl carrier protein transacylase [Minicystis rosea]
MGPDPWLPYRRPRADAKARLFCFPHAGGGATAYRGFQEALPASIEVCAVQLPGRENRLRETPIASLAKLIPLLADGLAPHLVPPFAFFGHSMGAVLAFELARTLRRRGAPLPAHLFASACPAPHIPDDDASHALSDDALIDHLRALGGMREEILAHRELMEMILPVFRADAALTETYVHATEPPLDLPFTAFGASSDTKATRADLEAWREHTTRGFTIALFPGDHFYIQGEARAPVLAAVARTLAALGSAPRV